MKNLFYLLLTLALLTSCKKINEFSTPGRTPADLQGGASVENLGHVFSGSNVSWKIHPQNPNNSPLFTYAPNQTGGYVMLMIDNNNYSTEPLKFIAVDFQKFTSKTIQVQNADGSYVQSALGKITRYTFGMDKNFYVATEASADGGGHLIQYNPNTQKALDLGKPFKQGDTYLGIYSLNVGIDSALYGGSFGGGGEVMTFRYKDNKLFVQNNALDQSSRYVVSSSGDNRYTYAVCGKNNWYLYAVDRTTGEEKTLLSSTGSANTFTMESTPKAVYASGNNFKVKLNGFNVISANNDVSTTRVEYAPYAIDDKNLPAVYWDEMEKKVYYTLANGVQGNISVSGVQELVYKTGLTKCLNNQIFITNPNGSLASYTPGVGFESFGRTTMTIYSIVTLPATSPYGKKVFCSGYPKGQLLEYTPNEPWTVNMTGYDGDSNGGYATTKSNPMLAASFQNADAAGVNGSMVAAGMEFTTNGYIVSAGNNDRITASGARELSMGSYRNGVVRNLYLPEFSNYEFQSMCLSNDSNYAYIGGMPHAGSTEKIYKYNPVTNSIVKSWDLPLWGDGRATFRILESELLVGFCDDMIFLFDLNKGEIIWKQILGQGQKIYGLAIAPDHSVYITHLYRQATNFNVVKYNFATSDRTNIGATATKVTELKDQDNDETGKPSGLLFVQSVTSSTDLYISGLKSFYRIRI